MQVKELAENAFDACKGQSKETYIRVCGLPCGSVWTGSVSPD